MGVGQAQKLRLAVHFCHKRFHRPVCRAFFVPGKDPACSRRDHIRRIVAAGQQHSFDEHFGGQNTAEGDVSGGGTGLQQSQFPACLDLLLGLQKLQGHPGGKQFGDAGGVQRIPDICAAVKHGFRRAVIHKNVGPVHIIGCLPVYFRRWRLRGRFRGRC